MPLVTVRFTRVFDRLAGNHRGSKYTVFSFDSDIGTRYGASVPAHTAIEAGMCYCLSREGRLLGQRGRLA